MRYESRTSKAIELVGGRDVLLKTMAANECWTNPVRTLETWLSRKRISGDGKVFIWRLANEKEINIVPDDLDVVDVAERTS